MQQFVTATTVAARGALYSSASSPNALRRSGIRVRDQQHHALVFKKVD